MDKKYISCDLIENGLDLNVTSINFCCRSSGAGGFKELISDYHGEPIDWEKFFKIKQGYKDILRQGKMIPECEGCIYLYEKEWDNDNYIATINLNNWTKCNMKCTYCLLENFIEDNPKFKHYNVLPLFKEMIKKKILKPSGTITIAGGEPTIVDEFEKLINLLLDYQFECITILTNGTKYSKAIEKGLKAGKIHITISTDSGKKETFEKIKRVKCYDKVWNNIKKYASIQKYGHQVKTKYIICPKMNDNYDEIESWLQKNLETGIKTITADIESEWYAKNDENIPIEIYNLLNYMIEQSEKYNLNFEPRDRAVLVIKKFGNNHHVKFRGAEI